MVKVLLVEDNPLNMELIIEILQSQGSLSIRLMMEKKPL